MSLINLSGSVFINLSIAMRALLFPTRTQLERNRTGSAKAHRMLLCSGIVEGLKALPHKTPAPETLSFSHNRTVGPLIRERAKKVDLDSESAESARSSEIRRLLLPAFVGGWSP